MIELLRQLLKVTEKQRVLGILEKLPESPRNKEIFRMALDHKTYVSIGEMHNVTPDRVRQIVYRIERKCREKLFPLNEVEALELSGRVRNVLRNERITTKAELRSALESGECWRWPNFGDKCFTECHKALS